MHRECCTGLGVLCAPPLHFPFLSLFFFLGWPSVDLETGLEAYSNPEVDFRGGTRASRIFVSPHFILLTRWGKYKPSHTGKFIDHVQFAK